MAEKIASIRNFIHFLEQSNPDLDSWQKTAKRLRQTWNIWD